MQRAWQQVQKVYEANRIVRGFQFIAQVSLRYTEKFFAVVPPAQLLAVTAAVHAKVLGSPTTIRQQLQSSRLRAPVFSSAFRRLARPAGKLAQRLSAHGNAAALRRPGGGGQHRTRRILHRRARFRTDLRRSTISPARFSRADFRPGCCS